MKIHARCDAQIVDLQRQLKESRKAKHIHGMDVCAYCAAGDLAIAEVRGLKALIKELRNPYN